MLKRCLRLLIIGILCFAVTSPVLAQVRDSVLQFEISDLLKSSAAAWNRGDLDAFMADYLDSDQATFTSEGQVLRGPNALRERYQKLYGSDKQAMGQLSFSDVEVWRLGPSQALVLGHWKLQPRQSGSKSASEGVFSLVMLQIDNKWKIFHDHTSILGNS